MAVWDQTRDAVGVARELTQPERRILDLLLTADFPGASELRAQAVSVRAEREGMIIDLITDSAVPTAEVRARVPVQAVVDGQGYDGGLLLFVDGGRLSALEYWWVTEAPPEVMPPLEVVGRPIPSA